MIHVMARINVKPESAAAARDILIALVSASRKEAGCLAYELFQRPDADVDGARAGDVEHRDREALAEHLELLDGAWALHVGSDQEGLTAL